MNQVLGNTRIVPYGIQNEDADLRVHVGVKVGCVFVFEPRYANEAIRTGKYQNKPTYTGAIKTATGHLVPPEEIKGCRMIPIPKPLLSEMMFSAKDDTSSKGQKAERLIRKMLQQGLLSTVISTVAINVIELQNDGLDLIPEYAQSIQVKCDWAAGPKQLGGSGNLYLQDGEANPLKKY